MISQKNFHSICRIVVHDENHKWNNDKQYLYAIKVLKKFCNENYKNKKFNIIVTFGNFLSFPWPTNHNRDINFLYKIAEKKIKSFLKDIELKKLKYIGNYLIIGIDSIDESIKIKSKSDHVELIAVVDLHNPQKIFWTGKSYPTKKQQNKIILCEDIESHFMKLNNQNVLVLGCHDLTVFNPRVKSTLKNEKKKKTIESFCNLIKKHQPSIIIQLSHNTDTSRTWASSWSKIENNYKFVKEYVSGLKYSNLFCKKVREELEIVLKKTKKGDVEDFIYEL